MDYVIIAGVNGSGKSTLYHNGYLNKTKLGVRHNLDEVIQRDYGNRWNDFQAQKEASRIVTSSMNDCLLNGKTFNQETTLTGSQVLRTAQEAKNRGFGIVLHYVGLESVELSIERVNARVLKGGHGIDEETLRRRYIHSFENLQKLIPICDKISIYDNSKSITAILDIEHGVILHKKETVPEYLKNVVGYSEEVLNRANSPDKCIYKGQGEDSKDTQSSVKSLNGWKDEIGDMRLREDAKGKGSASYSKHKRDDR